MARFNWRKRADSAGLSAPPAKVGLALGGGAARGWSHIGVIEALNELGVPVDLIAGTSIGSLVGAVYLSDGLATLKEVVLQLDRRQLLSLLDVRLPRSGLIDGQRVADGVRTHLSVQRIEDLPKPFRAVATDLQTGSEIIIDRGDVIDAVRASISIPGLFTPVLSQGTTLVDGGLVNPIPVSVARAMGAEIVIAVDINHYVVKARSASGRPAPPAAPAPPSIQTRAPDPNNRILAHFRRQLERFQMPDMAPFRNWLGGEGEMTLLEVILTATAIMEVQIAETRLQVDPPDLMIRPAVGGIRSHEFDRGREAIAAGYRETLAVLGPHVTAGRLVIPPGAQSRAGVPSSGTRR